MELVRPGLVIGGTKRNITLADPGLPGRQGWASDVRGRKEEEVGSREQSYSGDHERAKRSANSKGSSLSLPLSPSLSLPASC